MRRSPRLQELIENDFGDHKQTRPSVGQSRSGDWGPQWLRFAKMRKARKDKTNPYILPVAHVTII
jgi:hypothetical protein